MVAIVTRAGKGSPLTNTEVDDNFLNLNSGKVENTQAGILAALGYTPANKAGDTFTGAVVFDDKITVGTSATASTNYRFGKGITGGASSSAFVQNGNVQSDVTTTAVSFNSQANTVAASFTLTNYFHFYAQQGTVGAGSTLSSITGFYADNTLSGSSTTYGFRGGVGSGSGKWNLFMDGSAQNYVAGNLLIGSSSLANGKVVVGGNLTGQTLMSAVRTEMTVMSDVTTGARGFQTLLGTQAAAFTLPDIIHYRAVQGTVGAGSTITSQSGFVADATLVGAGSNFGFRGAIPSGSNRWNLYMDGTASNFLGGNLIVNAPLGFGAAGSPGYGTSGQFLKSAGSAAAPSWGSLTSGEVTTALGYTPLSGNQTITVSGDASGSGATSIALTLANSGVTAGTYTKVTVDAKGRVTTGASLASSDVTTALGYTPYNSTNPNGYTSNTGTVTSVSGTGTVSGLTLTGTVTGSGSLTLGGTLSLTSGQVTTALGYTPYNSTNPSGYITSSGTSAAAYRATIDTAPVAVMNSDGTFYGHVARRTTQQWGMGWGNGVGTATTFGIYYDTSGNFTATGNVTAYSDERLKRNWRDLPEDFVEQLALVKHGIYDRTDSAITQVGVSAQSLRNPLPNAVDEDVLTGTLSVNYGNAALVASVALAKQVVELKKQLKAVQEKLGV